MDRNGQKDGWMRLMGLPVCSCGRSMAKKGMMRELRSDKNHRPGPTVNWIRSSVAEIGMECPACRRDWRVKFLCCDRFETRGRAPVDVWPIPRGEEAETVLRRVLAQREAESRRPPAKPPAEYRPSTQEDADRAKRWIAKNRAQAGWTG